MQKNQWTNREKLDKIRDYKLNQLITEVYQNVPFYANELKKRRIEPKDIQSIVDIKKLPIVNKELIRDNFSDFTNSRFDLIKCPKDNTSGSMGIPFKVYYDKHTWFRAKYLSKLRSKLACGTNIGEKLAFFECEPQDKLDKSEKEIISYFKKIFFRRKSFSMFLEMDVLIDYLNKFKPNSFYGSPSHFIELASNLSNEHKLNFSPKRIFTSSEYLQENSKKFIQEKFCSEVYDIYGCTEIKEVAWQCQKHEGYHINEDEVIIEILDENGKDAKFGQIGSIVLTGLFNITMPFIRYDLGDKGFLIKEKCSCGRTFMMMQPTAGREIEYIELKNRKRLNPYLFAMSIKKIKGIIQFQVVQKSYDILNINVVANNQFSEPNRNKLMRLAKKLTANKIKIRILLMKNIPREKNGKFRLVKKDFI